MHTHVPWGTCMKTSVLLPYLGFAELTLLHKHFPFFLQASRLCTSLFSYSLYILAAYETNI